MHTILRGEWKFEGFVVSDYTGDEEMIAHGFARDRSQRIHRGEGQALRHHAIDVPFYPLGDLRAIEQ